MASSTSTARLLPSKPEPATLDSGSLLVVRLPVTGYEEAWDLQRQLAAARRVEATGDVLLLLEHPHTVTLGRRASADHLLLSERQLRRRGIGLYHVDRGGDITYHGPGQLVGYPILKLPGTRLDRVGYLRDLELAMLHAVRALKVPGELHEGLSGVWVGDEKVCALGAKIDAYGVTTHGFALNVNTDLSYFRAIVPCGLHDKGVTSLQHELGRHVSMRRVQEEVVRQVERVFGLHARSTGPASLYRKLAQGRPADAGARRC